MTSAPPPPPPPSEAETRAAAAELVLAQVNSVLEANRQVLKQSRLYLKLSKEDNSSSNSSFATEVDEKDGTSTDGRGLGRQQSRVRFSDATTSKSELRLLQEQNAPLQRTVLECGKALLEVQVNSDLKLKKLELENNHLRASLSNEKTKNHRLLVSCEGRACATCGDATRRIKNRDRAVEKHLTSLLASRNQAVSENYHLRRLLLKGCVNCRQSIPSKLRKQPVEPAAASTKVIPSDSQHSQETANNMSGSFSPTKAPTKFDGNSRGNLIAGSNHSGNSVLSLGSNQSWLTDSLCSPPASPTKGRPPRSILRSSSHGYPSPTPTNPIPQSSNSMTAPISPSKPPRSILKNSQSAANLPGSVHSTIKGARLSESNHGTTDSSSTPVWMSIKVPTNFEGNSRGRYDKDGLNGGSTHSASSVTSLGSHASFFDASPPASPMKRPPRRGSLKTGSSPLPPKHPRSVFKHPNGFSTPNLSGSPADVPVQARVKTGNQPASSLLESVKGSDKSTSPDAPPPAVTEMSRSSSLSAVEESSGPKPAPMTRRRSSMSSTTNTNDKKPATETTTSSKGWRKKMFGGNKPKVSGPPHVESAPPSKTKRNTFGFGGQRGKNKGKTTLEHHPVGEAVILENETPHVDAALSDSKIERNKQRGNDGVRSKDQRSNRKPEDSPAPTKFGGVARTMDIWSKGQN